MWPWCWHSVYVTQTIPKSVPELLKPDFSKLDIIKLKADIPKFPKAGVPKDKMEFWQNIEKHLHGIECKSLPAEEWLLEVLQKRKMNQLQQHISSPSASPLPEELLSAHMKETAPLPEVRTLNHSATQLPPIQTQYYNAFIYLRFILENEKQRGLKVLRRYVKMLCMMALTIAAKCFSPLISSV